MNDKIHTHAFTLPAGLRVYAIGDIHGHLSALDAMIAKIAQDMERHAPPAKVHMVYLGDYIDRGPDSAGVLSRLIERNSRQDGITRSFLQGNHEIAMMDFMRNPFSVNGSVWLDWGGLETLASYGICVDEGEYTRSQERILSDRKTDSPQVTPHKRIQISMRARERAADMLRKVLPEAHQVFLSRLERCFWIGGYFFAHAGVRPDVALDRQSEEDLCFIREPFLSWDKPLARMVVHGHTIAPEPVIKPHRIGIDTGIYISGTLTAAVLEADTVRFLQVSR